MLTQQWQQFYPPPAAAAAAAVLQQQQHRRSQHGCCQRAGSPEVRPPGGPQGAPGGALSAKGPTLEARDAWVRRTTTRPDCGKKNFERPKPFCPVNWRPVHKCLRAGCQRGLPGVPWGSLGPWSSLRFLMVSWGTLRVLGVLRVPWWSLGFLRHGRLIGH